MSFMRPMSVLYVDERYLIYSASYITTSELLSITKVQIL